MIQASTKLIVKDNSGVKYVKCIKVLGKSRQSAKIGDTIMVSIQKLKNMKLKRKSVVKALIINTKKENKLMNNCNIQFDKNQCVLLNTKNQLIGSRVLGITTKNLRNTKFLKVLLQSVYII